MSKETKSLNKETEDIKNQMENLELKITRAKISGNELKGRMEERKK